MTTQLKCTLMNFLITGQIKFIAMKYYIILTLILLVIVGCGTDLGGERTFNYTIANTSGVKIEMIPYYNGAKDITNKVILNNADKINKTFTDIPPYSAYFRMYKIPFVDLSTNLNNITHIEITFNNSKKIIHEGCTQINQCSNQSRNIFNPIFSDERTETYTITPEDYQNAIDCGGNCN